MALIGNCKNIFYTDHESETETQTITSPDGSSEDVVVPVRVKNETNHENVYLSIKQVENLNFTNSNDYGKYIFIQYAAYADRETRQADQEDFLFWKATNMPNQLDHTKPLYEQVYNYIKTIEGLTELTNG